MINSERPDVCSQADKFVVDLLLNQVPALQFGLILESIYNLVPNANFPTNSLSFYYAFNLGKPEFYL